jgi:hypothetical protein
MVLTKIIFYAVFDLIIPLQKHATERKKLNDEISKNQQVVANFETFVSSTPNRIKQLYADFNIKFTVAPCSSMH